ncbi:MAG: aspartate kinase, monofunctional class [Candidatus Korarchaeota archaeon]|nr:aspartate kinase, monofunctional class [Candidatus Korarchaeota archaeon]
MLVMKFGGSILRSASDYEEIAEYLQEFVNTERAVVVVSAMRGITDQLINLGEYAARGDEFRVKGLLSSIREKHEEVCQQLGLSCKLLNEELERLEKITIGITYIGEITPGLRDLIASIGENLSGGILSELLQKRGIRSRFFTGGEAGIVTDDSYGEAHPLMKATRVYVRSNLLPILEDTVPVVAGFSGLSQEGKVTTLGRGGSDLTAVLLGSSLEVREVWLWSDVDGMLTADPKIVKDARLIKQISYREAIELAHFGAKRMHPRFLEPAIATNTPIRIRNFFNRDCSGTLISSREVIREEGVVKAVGLRKDVAILTVRGAGMVGRPGTAAKLFSILGENRINIMMISQSISESDISVVVERDNAERARGIIEARLLGPIYREVLLDRNCAVLAAIGAGMRGTPGVAARVFDAVSSRGINVKMIAQGSSEVNISFVVDEGDGEEAVRAIHSEFSLGKAD